MTPTSGEIIKAISEHLGLNPEDLDRHALLVEELGLGPIELNDLLVSLSHKFNISFDPSEVKGLQKVEDLAVLVEDNLLD